MEEKKPEEEKKEGEEKKVEADEKKGEESEKKTQEGEPTKESKDESPPAAPEAPAPPPPPQEIVLKVYMHCEGCARKVRRCLKGFEGNLHTHTHILSFPTSEILLVCTMYILAFSYNSFLNSKSLFHQLHIFG